MEVVNFYKIGKQIPEDGVYIGRYNKNFNLQASIFANPFPIKNDSEEERERVIREYKVWLWKSILENRISKEDILTLKDKKLVCYCAPKKCHGHVLQSLIEYIINHEDEFDKKTKSQNPSWKPR